MTYYTFICCSAVCNSKRLEIIQRSSNTDWPNKLWYICTMENYYAERERERTMFLYADRDLQDISLIQKCKAQNNIYNIPSFVKGGRVKMYLLTRLYLQVATCRECGKSLNGIGDFSVFTFLYGCEVFWDHINIVPILKNEEKFKK